MLTVIPSLLTSDLAGLRDMLSKCEGVIDRVQIDIIDGVFAENKTVDPISLTEIETDLKLDFHLMVKEPVNWVEKCFSVGADRIIGQIEQMGDQVEFVGRVTELGAEVGLAIDLETPTESLDQTILTDLDVVLVMSVKAGFGGQKFDPLSLKKVKQLDEIRSRDGTPFKICVDGGIAEENLKSLVKAGADEVSVGRKLFKGDLASNIERYKEIAYG